MEMKTILLGAAMLLTAAAPAPAGTIVGAVSAIIDSGDPSSTPSENGDIADTYNQNGLSANYTSGVTDFDTFVGSTNHTMIFSGFEWFSDFGTDSAQVTYDLGSVMSIDKMALWNEEFSGIGLLDLLVSTDGLLFVSLLPGLTPTDNPPFDGSTSVSYLADVFSFATTSLRYMRLAMSGCPQPNGNSYQSCSIGEVAFSTSTVPIPAALPLFVAGLGGLTWLSRRQKRKSHAAAQA